MVRGYFITFAIGFRSPCGSHRDQPRVNKILAIINPISGTENKEYIPDVINRCLGQAGRHVVVRFTQRASHATELTQAAISQGFEAVIAVGGDGTVNEVASALRDSPVALGIVPCGSGNGLARHLGIPLNAEKALAIIAQQNPVSLDYCTANEHPFFCTCGVGFDAQVSKKFAEAKKRGPISYIQSALIEFLTYRSQTYSIEADGHVVTEDAFIIACGNASQYGNNAFITPQASIRDGLIDVTVIHPFSPLDTPVMGVLLFTKHLDQASSIHTFRTSEFTIHRPKPDIMHVDGEPIMMAADIHIKCHKAGLRVLLPDGFIENRATLLTPIENGFWDFINTIRAELKI